MKIKSLFLGALAAVMAFGASAADFTRDAEGYPVMYIRGTMTNGWAAQDAYRFTRTGDNYSITLPSLNGSFKISADEWDLNYGADREITRTVTVNAVSDGGNFSASGLKDVTVSFTLGKDNFPETNAIRFTVPGTVEEPEPEPVVPGVSGTLPVLYINVYSDEAKTELDNEVISKDLAHKNYFSNAEYWLDVNGCQWLIDEGAKNVGSKEEPLPLEIKARGNYTRLAYAKKPFKLKLGKKQSLLGMSKSKHYAILAHADDGYGYLRNFTGFNLGRRIGLPWTPWQQPVEVVINGDYRGLYFLTESIRIEEERVNITELDDNVAEPELISGGYIVELDNYDEENQIRMEEKTCADVASLDMLRITWDTPEEYSDLQKRFVTDQFTAMNDAVGTADKSDELWRYMDMDDAVRYYIVEELISHTEAYHGSTYLFRDRGEGQKWHFSPLWDCGNGFNGPADQFFYNASGFGATWIPSIRHNESFNKRLRDTWAWFMNNGFKGIYDDMSEYAGRLQAAAKADRKRWKDAPLPEYPSSWPVVDNTDMTGRLQAATAKLSGKVEWLKGQFGDFTATPSASEPVRDATEAAPLPAYAKAEGWTSVYFIDSTETPWEQVYVYMWGGEPNYEGFGAWPGTAMTATTFDGKPAWELKFAPADMNVSDASKLIFNDGVGGVGSQTDSFGYVEGGVYNREGFISGIGSVTVGDNNAPVEFYNLQGMRVSAPRAGETYIRVCGDDAVKVRM